MVETAHEPIVRRLAVSDEELARHLADLTAATQRPLLHVIFDELEARGWTIERGEHAAGFIDPEGNRHGTVEAAIAAQTFREIAGA